MKARYASDCPLCRDGIAAGEEIGKWLGAYVHITCRETEVERRKANLEGAIQIPMEGPTKITGYGYATGWTSKGNRSTPWRRGSGKRGPRPS